MIASVVVMWRLNVGISQDAVLGCFVWPVLSLGNSMHAQGFNAYFCNNSHILILG